MEDKKEDGVFSLKEPEKKAPSDGLSFAGLDQGPGIWTRFLIEICKAFQATPALTPLSKGDRSQLRIGAGLYKKLAPVSTIRQERLSQGSPVSSANGMIPR